MGWRTGVNELEKEKIAQLAWLSGWTWTYESKVHGFIPGHGTCLGNRLDSQCAVCRRQPLNGSLSSLMFLSLPLPSFLKSMEIYFSKNLRKLASGPRPLCQNSGCKQLSNSLAAVHWDRTWGPVPKWHLPSPRVPVALTLTIGEIT
uniref:Uncharacterized protein n=1 Tax=Pipistrellus kuhlii TaxID=59472 RepID=A0A7J7YA14_PIPKU|nr:hypothetical protein mPipKuh1_010303 [Pipistrellus kuhlii]